MGNEEMIIFIVKYRFLIYDSQFARMRVVNGIHDSTDIDDHFRCPYFRPPYQVELRAEMDKPRSEVPKLVGISTSPSMDHRPLLPRPVCWAHDHSFDEATERGYMGPVFACPG